MNLRLKKMLALLVCFTTIAVSAGCSTKGKNTESNAVNLNTKDLDDTAEDQLAMQKEIKGKGGNITILWPGTDDSFIAQCYKQQYSAMCGGTIDFVCVQYSDVQQKLVAMHQSGQDPDLVNLTNQDFPSMMYKNILTGLNDKIDFSNSCWDKKRSLLEQFAWDGVNYFVPDLNSDMFLWWNRSIFEQAGISSDEMPDALLENDNWTWDTFYELEKKVADVNNGVYGFGNTGNLLYWFAASAGEDFVKYGENGFESNVKNPNLTRAMNMLKKTTDVSLAVDDGNKAYDLFKRGKVAMLLSITITKDKVPSQMLKDGTIEATVFPRDPNMKEYCTMANIGGYGIPIGSKNIDAAVAFLKMFRASDYYNREMSKISDNMANFDDNTKAIRDKINDENKLVPCYSLGIKEIQTLCWNSIGTLRQGATTWETVAAGLDPQLKSELNKLG